MRPTLVRHVARGIVRVNLSQVARQLELGAEFGELVVGDVRSSLSTRSSSTGLLPSEDGPRVAFPATRGKHAQTQASRQLDLRAEFGELVVGDVRLS